MYHRAAGVERVSCQQFRQRTERIRRCAGARSEAANGRAAQPEAVAVSKAARTSTTLRDTTTS